MTETQTAQTALHDAAPTPTPIAQLQPDISDQQTRVVDGVITIIWPFSIVTKSIAFILAESDVLLRRDKGQVRVRFRGAAAKAIADSGAAGGDAIRLGLEGVQWEKNEMHTQLAGNTLEWQLEFTNRLLLRITKIGDDVPTVLDVNVSNAGDGAVNGQHTNGNEMSDEQPTNNDLAIPIPASPEITLPAKRLATSTFEEEELSSPAFIKRARVSYGSLFEAGFDIFDEPKSKKKPRRRTRFSLPATAWRYSSKSPSPSPEPEEEPDQESVDEMAPAEAEEPPQEPAVADVPMDTPSRPRMVDGACQTVESDHTPMTSARMAAEGRHEVLFGHATPTPLPRRRPGEVNTTHELPFGFVADAQSQHTPSPASTAGFLGNSPAHIDAGVGFTFGSSHPALYQPGQELFPTSHPEEAVVDHTGHLQRPEDYPSSFLDDHHVPGVGVEIQVDSQGAEHPTLHFQPEAQFYSPFQGPVSQAPPRSWGAPIHFPPNSVDNPVEISSSSPTKRGAIAEHNSSPVSNLQDDMPRGPQELRDAEADESEQEPVEEETSRSSSESDDHYRDGGDRPGDDYDLRNYDTAQDDDDDGRFSEIEPVSGDGDDPEVTDPEESGEEGSGDQDEVYSEGDYRGEVAAYDVNQGYLEDAEDYSEEEGYEYEEEEEGEEDEDEEDGSDEEEEQKSFQPPQEPIFISLLSDSEDEVEDDADAQSEAVPERQAQEPGPTKTPDPPTGRELELAEESDLDEGPEPDVESPVQAQSNEDGESQGEIDEDDEESQHPSNQPSPQSSRLDKTKDAMETDHEEDEDPAETSEIAGDTVPLEDGMDMDVDGSQSPETSPPPRDGTPDLQTRQQEATREEGLSASSMDRGVPTDANHKELGKEADGEQDEDEIIVSTDDVPAIEAETPAAPQESNGDGEMDDEAEISPKIHLPKQELVVKSGDDMEKMDVDVVVEEVQVALGQDHDAVGTGSDNTTSRTMDENAMTSTACHEGEEATDVVQESAEIVATPGSGPRSSNVGGQGMPQTEVNEITGTAPESPGPSDSSGSSLSGILDATMQDAAAVLPSEQAKQGGQQGDDQQGDDHPQQGENQQQGEEGKQEQGDQQDDHQDDHQDEQARPTQSGTGECEEEDAPEASRNQQLASNTPFSPPPTQASEFQNPLSQDVTEPLASQASTTSAIVLELDLDLDLDADAHLPTPFGTQPDAADMRAQHPAEHHHHLVQTEDEDDDDEDDVGPEDQIMAEILQHSPVRPKSSLPVPALQQPAPATTTQPGVLSPTHPTQPESPMVVQHEEHEPQQQPHKGEQGGEQGLDKTITVKSLRSRGQRSSARWSDLTKAPHPDPSVLLARSPAPPKHEGEVEIANSPHRVTRSKADSSDPSIPLARASLVVEDVQNTIPRRSSSPPPPLGNTRIARITRSKGDATDPSVLLARASRTAEESQPPTTASSPPSALRAKRSKLDHPDPSIPLAKAPKEKGDAKASSSSPPATTRVTRSMADHPDPCIQLAKAPSARQSRRHQTPELPPRETRSGSKGLPRGDTPVTAATLTSPSVAGSASVHEDESVAAVKAQLVKSLRTTLPDYVSLKVLRHALNKLVDVMAIATATPNPPQRPKSGPRDYMLSLNLTDPASAPTGITVANVFRPHLSSLPVVNPGDVVLLRQVNVVSMRNRGFGLRTVEGSAWAVFEKHDAEMLPQIKGPPVELSDEELRYAEGLRRWWSLLDEKALEKMEKASRKVSDATKEH